MADPEFDAAERERKAAFDHFTHVSQQTNDKNTIAAANKRMEAANARSAEITAARKAAAGSPAAAPKGYGR